MKNPISKPRFGVPASFPVRPLAKSESAADRVTCGHCNRTWDDAIVTSHTPAPSGRCPFETFHKPIKGKAGLGPFQQQFQVDDIVTVDSVWLGCPADLCLDGQILGLATEGLLDMWIVLLDQPLLTHKAIVVPSAAMTLKARKGA